MKILIKYRFSLFFWLILWSVSVQFVGCMQFRMSDTQLKQWSKKNAIDLDIQRIKTESHSLRFALTGNLNAKNALFFIHGAPGGLDAYLKYLNDPQLYESFTLLSVDRPGYGYSTFGKEECSIQKQALLLLQILDKLKDFQNVYLVGHSYGGPIACEMAYLNPERIKGILLIAPALSSEDEKIFWFTHWIHAPILRWMLPTSLKVASFEKVSHTKELKEIEAHLKSLQLPVIHMHGKKDNLVPFANLEFSKRTFQKEYLTLLEYDTLGHLIIFQNKELVLQTIQNQLIR